ncbi:MAG: phenylacetic acid degradation protein [Tistrella sp.]|uniref:PaaI family thioesterase n=1 Tax=Tistrella mobilis TaxID=171437 RepID=A0A3B9IFS1_9PROT|nr:PaaI family thioesterase [Tistrella sp.]MAD38735.1 phenylacetic acid degradation protein [Tistrella sp.]MBA76755.1 phenylacetic acid degradation protein [Tistrella sp.]HAE46620.1 PaaI family thioesterase [Tistrella mobilis]|tara:strand:- start:1023 stop:1460 length:438 start_codon:yes stop_codon:yes gene_type:complete
MTFDDLKSLVASAEYHKFLKVEPVEADAEKGVVVLKLAFDPAYTIFAKAGNYHGGVTAALIDVAGAMACSVMTGYPTPTINLRVDYMQAPRRTGLTARGEVRRLGKAIGVADVTITDDAGEVCVIGRGTFSTVDPRPKLMTPDKE